MADPQDRTKSDTTPNDTTPTPTPEDSSTPDKELSFDDLLGGGNMPMGSCRIKMEVLVEVSPPNLQGRNADPFGLPTIAFLTTDGVRLGFMPGFRVDNRGNVSKTRTEQGSAVAQNLARHFGKSYPTPDGKGVTKQLAEYWAASQAMVASGNQPLNYTIWVNQQAGVAPGIPGVVTVPPIGAPEAPPVL